MIQIILERCALVNRVLISQLSAKTEKTFVSDAKAMAVGAMKEVGITGEVIRTQLNTTVVEFKDLEHMHEMQHKRGGYYYQDFCNIMSYVNQPALEEGDYESVKELSQKDIINRLKAQVQTLQTKLSEQCK